MQMLYLVITTLFCLRRANYVSTEDQCQCELASCYNPIIKEAIEGIISGWYLAQIEYVLDDKVCKDDFNKIIDTVFDCDDYRPPIEVCIDYVDTCEPCDIAKYDSCDDVRNQFFERWSAVNTGITFGKMEFECGANDDEIIVKVTKTFYSSEGNNFNLDTWTLSRIGNGPNEADNYRVTSWKIGAKRVDIIPRVVDLRPKEPKE